MASECTELILLLGKGATSGDLSKPMMAVIQRLGSGTQSRELNQDRDGDGSKELIAYSGVGSGYWICGMYSMRGTTATWRWDGEHYVLQREDPDPPRYSYEALEDGDRLAALGYFEEAILSYLRAISDTSLRQGRPRTGESLTSRTTASHSRCLLPRPTEAPSKRHMHGIG